ncbi:hypothetical protein [Sphingomicrobium clamense]|uniref:Uncharacterized protein n=1 Tax=Sphingomicrobium clamense TaxID=2851013 RepID=A0ABS6V5F2_9SPHN|nr:hypothetical protein [Sphingomicrobium sp. B8]MBW0144794.1 hypothetical protein [Sphingomicrobium sp. B8]
MALADFSGSPPKSPLLVGTDIDRFEGDLRPVLREEGLDAALEVVLSQLAPLATPELLAADETARAGSLDWGAICADAIAARSSLGETALLGVGLSLSNAPSQRSLIVRTYDRLETYPAAAPKTSNPDRQRSGSRDHVARFGQFLRYDPIDPLLMCAETFQQKVGQRFDEHKRQTRILISHLVVLRFIEAVALAAAKYGLPFKCALHAGGETISGPEGMFAARPDYRVLLECPLIEADEKTRARSAELLVQERAEWEDQTLKLTQVMLQDFERYGRIRPHLIADLIPEWHERAFRVDSCLPPSRSPEAFTKAELYELIGVLHAKRERDAPGKLA